ncbi:MAG: WbqC family protein [Methyloprofundus sp.]|nr:WbqC family protein [Methyloprofundus sp.]
MTILSAHQSQFLPWPPYFRKVAVADVFVWMDNVQFQRGKATSVQNRNKIWSPNGPLWITLPVQKSGLATNICDVHLVEGSLSKKSWKSIEVYRNSPYWVEHADALYKLLCEKRYTTLDAINFAFFSYIIEYYEISTKIILMSELQLNEQKSDLVLAMCKACGANVYLSGTGSSAYLIEDDFAANSIEIRYLESVPPIYKQFKSPSFEGLSMLDMMMNQSMDEIRRYLLEPVS